MRLGRELNQGYDLTSVPYFFLDRASGHSLAQAYDQVAAQLRSGVSAARLAGGASRASCSSICVRAVV